MFSHCMRIARKLRTILILWITSKCGIEIKKNNKKRLNIEKSQEPCLHPNEQIYSYINGKQQPDASKYATTKKNT